MANKKIILVALSVSAMTDKELIRKTDNVIMNRAEDCEIEDVGTEGGIENYLVTSSDGGEFRVEVKQEGRKVYLFCPCPAWRWRGPDYLSHHHGYALKSPVSDLSKPTKTDPEGDNYMCKHAAAVLLYRRAR